MGWSAMVELEDVEDVQQRWWHGDISPLTPPNIHNYSEPQTFGHHQKTTWDNFSYNCTPNTAFSIINGQNHQVSQPAAQDYSWSTYNEGQASLTPTSVKAESCRNSPRNNGRPFSSTENLVTDFEHLSASASKGSTSTDVDALMRVIQVQAAPSLDTDVQKVDKVKKRYGCMIAGCGKSFPQRTHLEVHMRAHSGAKPHACKFPACSKAFSQLGNLKTHERSHTGERPFQCKICKRCFAQKGNLRAHKSVHERATLYPCKLDHCGKQFTQLGNLKAHQNRFHAETLHELAVRFSDLHAHDKISAADKELFDYFASLYKHSNRGIKGRGKDPKTASYGSPASTEYSLSCDGQRDSAQISGTPLSSTYFPDQAEGEALSACGSSLGSMYGDEASTRAFAIADDAFGFMGGMAHPQ